MVDLVERAEADEMPAGYRMTELGLLPEDWRVLPLGLIAPMQLGRTPARATSPYWNDGCVPWVSIADLNNGRVTATRESISRRAFDEVFRGRIVQEGSLLMSFKLTIGKVGILDIPAVHNEAIASFLPGSSIDRDFLFFLLQATDFTRSVDSYVKGKTLNKDKMQRFLLPVPPLAEQRAIAQVLSTVQRAREATEAVIATTRELKRSLMRHLFTYGPVPLDQVGNMRLKETQIGSIPEPWMTTPLHSQAELITKGSSPKWQGFEYCDNGIPFVRSQNVGWGVLHLADVAYLPVGFNSKEKKSVLEPNDLLLNIVGASIGRVAVADKRVAGGNVNQAVSVVRLAPHMSPEFVKAFFLTQYGQYQIHRQKKQIARANISLQDVAGFAIPVPPPEEQRQITRLLGDIDSKVAVEQRRARALDELFRVLLRDMLRGRARGTRAVFE